MNDYSQEIDPEALRAANHADLLMQPVSEAAEGVVLELFDQTIAWEFTNGHRVRNLKADAADRMKSTIAALLGDLLVAALNQEADGFCYCGSKRKRFKYTMAESRHYETLRRAWVALGYMELVNGFQGSVAWDDGEHFRPNGKTNNWVSRLRATPKLLDLLDSYEITPLTTGLHFQRNLAMSQPIVLKASKNGPKQGRRIEFKKTKHVEKLEAEITEINSFLANHLFSFGPAPYLYRSFSNGDVHGFNWNLGGRFYASGESYLNWPSERRKQMTIDGDPVIEIDITACQLTLLHALMDEDLDLNRDPFQIEGLDRNRAKKTFNVIVGLGHVPEEDDKQQSTDRKAKERKILVQTYPILDRIEAEGWNSLKLQTLDADIMCGALLTLFRSHDIPALPVHDCLIVRNQDADVAEKVFKQAFEDRVGIVPRTTRE